MGHAYNSSRSGSVHCHAAWQGGESVSLLLKDDMSGFCALHGVPQNTRCQNMCWSNPKYATHWARAPTAVFVRYMPARRLTQEWWYHADTEMCHADTEMVPPFLCQPSCWHLAHKTLTDHLGHPEMIPFGPGHPFQERCPEGSCQ